MEPARRERVDRLQQRQAVAAAAAQVVDLAAARRALEVQEQIRDVGRVNLIAHLLAAVAEDRVALAEHGAADDVVEEAVELDGGVIGARQAAAAEHADRHLEVAPILLTQHIGGHLRRAEERVQALIDRKRLVDAVAAFGVVPAPCVLDERQAVGAIAIDLVGAEEAERRLAREVARRDQQVQRADGVDVEILVGNRCRLVVRGLRRGVDDEVRPLGAHQFAHAVAIADVQFDVAIPAQLARQCLHHRPRRAAGAEEPGAQIVVDADDVPALGGERARALRADQTARSRDECFHAPGVPCSPSRESVFSACFSVRPSSLFVRRPSRA